MPRKSKSKITSKKVIKKSPQGKQVTSLSFSKRLPKLNWSESYVSLFLGLVVVILIGLVIVSYVRSVNKGVVNETGKASSEEANGDSKQSSEQQFYTVSKGDSLWSISEKVYKNGYNWVYVAKANNIENPDVIYAGAKILVPTLTDETKTQIMNGEIAQNAPEGSTSYTVQKGDNLWDISVRTYGDGFRWTEISRVNKLANPSLIFAGNVLVLPRK